MKAKLVNESLNEFVGSMPAMTPETFSQIVDELIAAGDSVNAARTIKKIFSEPANHWMNHELGEIEGKNALVEPWKRISAFLDENPEWKEEFEGPEVFDGPDYEGEDDDYMYDDDDENYTGLKR